MKKIIIWVCALVLIGCAGATYYLFSFRWGQGLHNEPEPAYTATEAPQFVTLCMGWNGDQERTITWRTRDSLSARIYLEWTDAATHQLRFDSSEVKPPCLVRTQGGRAYYYSCTISEMQPGDYRYWVQCGPFRTDSCSFHIGRPDTLRFALFGDIAETQLPNPFSEFVGRMPAGRYQFMAYVGNVLTAPTDQAWQLWFQSMQSKQTQVAQAPTVGDNECRKGLAQHQDPRWINIFRMPNNGPTRFCGSCYYVDFQNLRVIYLNTGEIQTPIDLHCARSYLSWALNSALDKWRIVVMNHPVYPAAKGRSHYLYRRCFRGILQEADLVLAGHDHNYARREGLHTDALISGTGGNGVYSQAAARIHPSICIETVSCSTPRYEGQSQREDVCFLGHMPVYEDITVTRHSLHLLTRSLKTDTPMDELTLRK